MLTSNVITKIFGAEGKRKDQEKDRTRETRIIWSVQGKEEGKSRTRWESGRWRDAGERSGEMRKENRGDSTRARDKRFLMRWLPTAISLRSRRIAAFTQFYWLDIDDARRRRRWDASKRLAISCDFARGDQSRHAQSSDNNRRTNSHVLARSEGYGRRFLHRYPLPPGAAFPTAHYAALRPAQRRGLYYAHEHRVGGGCDVVTPATTYTYIFYIFSFFTNEKVLPFLSSLPSSPFPNFSSHIFSPHTLFSMDY